MGNTKKVTFEIDEKDNANFQTVVGSYEINGLTEDKIMLSYDTRESDFYNTSSKILKDFLIGDSPKKRVIKQKNPFNYSLFLRGQHVINCSTKEEAYMLLVYLYAKGLEWDGGACLLSKHCWNKYRENTVYGCSSHFFYGEGIWISSCEKSYRDTVVYPFSMDLLKSMQ